MNCHVLRIGLRPGYQSVLRLSTASTPHTAHFPVSVRSAVAAAAAAAAAAASSSSSSRHPASRLSSAARHTHRHVATKNSQTLPFGSSAAIGLHSNRTGAFHAHRTSLSIPERVSLANPQTGKAWKRSFSDEKGTGLQGKAEEIAKTNSANGSAADTSKSAAAHASGPATNKGLLDRLPHLHRPTKYELLATAETFWERLKINFKWYSIRSLRPFTIDEIGAFISWVFLGHLIWIVIGTTTFVSLAIWAVNTVFAQETLAGWVGNYLTKSSGLNFVFESAIVPTWSSGVITFNNVFVSRRPGQQAKKERTVKKGSSTAAAAEAAMIERSQDSSQPEDEGNYTQFDVTMNTVNVSLSFRKWFNGKGLLRDVEIIGIRGVIDRTSVQSRDYSIDPKSYRHEHSTGDFEIDNFKMTDVLLTVHQPDNFRPFTISVFNCDLPRLRKQWLFYDLMSANNMSGSFDDSLFTVHPRQLHGVTGVQLSENGMEEGQQQWKKHSRLRIDGLNIDHLNRGVEGTFSWIREGNVDIVADVMIPNDDDDVWRQSWRRSTEAISNLYDQVEATISSTQAKGRTPEAQSVIQHASDAVEKHHDPNADERSEADKRLLIFDIKVHLNDVRASVPLFTKDLSYVNNALIRPIVAYINSRPHAFIPVNCRVVKRQSEFDGSWTIFDSGLLDDLSRETYEAFARDIEDASARKRRMRKVGLWSLQLAAQALFIGLAGQLA